MEERKILAEIKKLNALFAAQNRLLAIIASELDRANDTSDGADADRYTTSEDGTEVFECGSTDESEWSDADHG
jgi:hypothetical protein